MGNFAVKLDIRKLSCFQKIDLALVDKGNGGIGVVYFYLKLLGGLWVKGTCQGRSRSRFLTLCMHPLRNNKHRFGHLIGKPRNNSVNIVIIIYGILHTGHIKIDFSGGKAVYSLPLRNVAKIL